MNTGGHAFPAMNDNGYWVGGMTLRDYFAAKAMAVVFPDVIKELQRGLSHERTEKLKQVATEACYAIADAMLKAREQ